MSLVCIFWSPLTCFYFNFTQGTNHFDYHCLMVYLSLCAKLMKTEWTVIWKYLQWRLTMHFVEEIVDFYKVRVKTILGFFRPFLALFNLIFEHMKCYTKSSGLKLPIFHSCVYNVCRWHCNSKCCQQGASIIHLYVSWTIIF